MNIRGLESKDESAVEAIYDLYWSGDFRQNLTKRLKGFVAADQEVVDQKFVYLIAEEAGEVLGVLAFRRAPDRMREFTMTKDPAELYILAVKKRGQGVGRTLAKGALEEIRKAGYTEIVLYSGETHKDSWDFYDQLGLERVGDAVAPNGENGKIWRMLLG